MDGVQTGATPIINVFDHAYQIRNGSGIGVFSPSYGARRALYAGIKIPLAPLVKGSP
ncbi:MAG: hypothetical protein WCA22_15910 [Candidatus Binatus sp.]